MTRTLDRVSVSSLPPRVAGLRVTRALARGERADLFLVRDETDSVLVAKVFRPTCARADIDRELVALARGAHRHVLPLLDVECASQGTVVAVVGHLPGGSLARWLEGRERVSAGEAVTVLTPLADAVEALHAAGVAHGRLTSARILFDADGAPVVTGLAAAVLFAPNAPPVVRERIPEVAGDLEALRGIADAVLGRVAGTGARRAAELRTEVAAAAPESLARALVDGLFVFAAGSPIRFADDPDSAPPPDAVAVPARMPDPVAAPAPARPPQPSPRAVPAPAGARTALTALLEQGPLAVVTGAARRRWTTIDTGRRRVVVGVLAAATTAAVAVVLVPGGSGGSSRAESGPEPAASASAPRTAPTLSRTPRAPAPRERSSAAVRSGDPSARSVQDADPLVALPVLLRTRERCLRDQDRECLSATDEPGSPADAADAAAVDAGSGLAVSVDGARVVQVLGAATMIETGQPPQRIVLVRLTSGGWRIRDLPTAALG